VSSDKEADNSAQSSNLRNLELEGRCAGFVIVIQQL
jgi:hypothetical protein